MSSRSSVFRAICLLFFVFLSACHALTVDEGEQVAMVMDKIEKAAATRKQQQGQQQQQQQRQLALTGAISVAAGCFNDWASLVLAGPFSNNTALYLCDGFSNALPILASLTIPAGIDVTISCLGVCVATGGGLINGFFDVQAGGRLDLFGIDFDNVAGPVARVSGANSFLGVASCSFENGGRLVGNGGVFVAAFGGVLTIMGSTFTGNQAESGGVFSVQDSAALIVKDSNFEYNKALFYSGTITSGFGGGVVHMRRAATAQFTNCNFQGNQAASNGGVADVNDANTKIKFVDCILNANSAAIRGGAIHTRGPVPAPPTPVGGTVDIIGNCQITNNRARFGGAIDVRAAYVVTLTGASFGSMQVQGNLANSTQGDLGGFARVVDQGQLIIQNANIKDSVSKGAGGAIHLDSVTPFFMTNSIMEKNKANGNTVNRQKGDHIYGSAGTTFGNNVCGENIFITPSALGNGIVIFNVSVCGT